MKNDREAIVAIYNAEGELILESNSHKDIKDLLDVSYSTISSSIKEGYKIAGGHTLLSFQAKDKIPLTIEVEKTYPKFRNPKNSRMSRMYLAYSLEGILTHDKPLFLNEMIDYLGVHKDTILDGIVKNHLCNFHIVRVARSQELFPKKLSPLAKEFKLFQYDRAGKLVAYYTAMSVASRVTGIDYDTIRNCTIKAISTHPQFYFTTQISLSNYKKITVRFKEKYQAPQVFVSCDGSRELMSLNKATSYIGTSYPTLKRKIEESPRFIFKGFLIEQATQ